MPRVLSVRPSMSLPYRILLQYVFFFFFFRFCVGDRFYLYENRILCEADYAEKLLPNAGAATGSANQPASHINTNLNSSITHQNANSSKLHSQHSANRSGDRIATNFNLKSLADFGVFGMRAAGATAGPAAASDHHVVVR